ncbi:hypothetical protein TNCV_3374191 [Trichonephila clavipes]|nr:hypothetical protein TNCV_3374191 [Trichonephila clavipes]
MKNDLKATSSELVYGTTLRLPSDLISSESLQTSVTPTYFRSSYHLMCNPSLQVFNPYSSKASEVADRILEVTPVQEVKELRRSRSFSRNHFDSRNRGKSLSQKHQIYVGIIINLPQRQENAFSPVLSRKT